MSNAIYSIVPMAVWVSCLGPLSATFLQELEYCMFQLQHSLNVSLVRLHTNKPAGTRGLTPTWLISTSFLPVRSEPRAERMCLFALVDVRNALIIFASTKSACVQTHFRCMNNRIIRQGLYMWHFTCDTLHVTHTHRQRMMRISWIWKGNKRDTGVNMIQLASKLKLCRNNLCRKRQRLKGVVIW